MIKKRNNVDVEKAFKESCEKNGILLFENLKMVCEKENVRKFNDLNKNSLVLRFCDIDKIEEFKDIEYYDNNGDKVLDISLYLPSDKAYIILNRVHFGKLYEDKQKYVMEQFVNYLLSPSTFKYFTSAIYIYLPGFNVEKNILEEIGFFEYGPNGTHLLCHLNTNFFNDISSVCLDEETKNHILKCYKSLNKTKNKYLYRIKICLENSNYALKTLLEEKRKGKSTNKLIEYQKYDISHYEEILGNYNN